MAELISGHPHVDRVWPLRREEGLAGLWRLAKTLRTLKLDRIYDAHNNLRSRILCLLLFPTPVLRRSLYRFRRFLLFRFGINKFPMPFSGQRDLLKPLQAWGIPTHLPDPPQIFPSPSHLEKARDLVGAGEFVCLAPSAAYPLKRWPVEYWKELVRRISDTRFVLLGGPNDHFLTDICAAAPDRVINLSGKTGLMESAAVVSLSQVLISNDTGVLHLGEQLGKPTIALMGPAPFGFPSRATTLILERDLPCRPCSKHGQGPCRNSQFQKCLVDIRPAEVIENLRRLLGRPI
ncbi:MAG: glycosyltransferase family 9 protein [Bdellovibrionaceae bacterium]|nr:glycosyltransferase family 9 protein [Pseudobdellovibrionaceae bacterium]